MKIPHAVENQDIPYLKYQISVSCISRVNELNNLYS